MTVEPIAPAVEKKRMRASRILISVVLVIVVIGSPAAASASAQPTGARRGPTSIWTPEPGLTLQWQLQGKLDTSIDVDVYNIDMFDNTARVVDRLHEDGRKVICYISAGSWERWRPDAADFPRSVLGKKLDGWPGERWLDVRRVKKLRPIMNERMNRCAAKGFDAIEFDNVDGYTNRTGFPLKGRHQKRFNRYLARAAHDRGLAAGLKNDLAQIDDLEPHFDFAVNEQCFQYHECGPLERFIDAGKAVFQIEYELRRSEFCPQANARGFSSMKKRYSLRVWRRPC